MGKWIELETDASTGKPYLWKCDECGEEVETKWNYCPECGDPKTGKAKSINTLVKALETEHRKLKEMQSKLGTNLAEVGTDCISRQAAIDGINKLMEIHFDRKIVLKKARDVVEQLPPAQPEIIRCKDCKEYDPIYTGGAGVCGHWNAKTEEDIYCGYAERKETRNES